MLHYPRRADCAHWPDAALARRLADVLADRPGGHQVRFRRAELLALLAESTTRLARQVAALKTQPRP